ncbi:MAG: ribonuclease H-like domain-containing protein [Patescibacteria group bacterium]|nr:ribonuclease H-like domain-containing protein [Patescibacteria group bacterium]
MDLETKFSFREFSDPRKLEISVVAVFNYADNSTLVFEEREIYRLFPLIEKASLIIGFNVLNFDLEVLKPYYPGEIKNLKVLDLLEDIKAKIGKRISLNELAFATLNKKKSSSGMEAINYFREGKIDQLKKYCQEDVILTKQLFDYGVINGMVYYFDISRKTPIKVSWKKYLEEVKTTETPLTLPF